jgi:U5 snRNP protein, DIM1 family
MADQNNLLPPTKTLLTKAWDVDRFIVLGSVEKLVAIFFCPFFDQMETGVKPLSKNGEKQEDLAALRKQQQYVVESAMMKNTLDRIGTRVSRFCTIYYVDTSKVTEFDALYELFADEPFALMFFYKNKHVKVDVGTGNNNKINFPVDEDDLIYMVEGIYIGAKAGKPVVDSRKQFSQYTDRGQ